MENIEIALRVALVLDALGLIALILVQQGKGANVGAAFGSGASQTMFGSGGASSFLNTVVTWLAVGFFVITFALAWTARERAQTAGTVGIPDVPNSAPASSAPADTAPAPDGAPLDDSDMPSLQVQPKPAQDGDLPSGGDSGSAN